MQRQVYTAAQSIGAALLGLRIVGLFLYVSLLDLVHVARN
eukprot:COSAG01_NODE_58525_length_305_cov_1.252427_2_plen_39_part_01